MQLAPGPSIGEGLLPQRFLPLAMLCADKRAPSRDVILTSVGFPLGLGAVGYFSPLTSESKASSGLLTPKPGQYWYPMYILRAAEPQHRRV